MEVLHHTTAVHTGPPGPDSAVEDELARLRAEVAVLQAERTALMWAVGHDELTGLANRRLFHSLAPSLLDKHGAGAAVLVLDLDGFKPINDHFGHDVGDNVLRVIARRIACCVEEHLVARFGGDEFAAVLTCPRTVATDGWWWHSAGLLAASIAEPMLVAGHRLRVTASIGIAPRLGDVLVPELLRRADYAMYQAKLTRRAHAALDADDRPTAGYRPPLAELQMVPAPALAS